VARLFPSRWRSGRSQQRLSKAALETLEPRTLFSTISVVTTADSGAGSLRQAITTANVTKGASIIDFSSDVIGTISLASVLPTLHRSIAIEGPGASELTIDGQGHGSVFTIGAGISAEIDGLTITGGDSKNGGGIFSLGKLTINNLVIDGNSAGGKGGGIYSGRGKVTATNSTICNNSASGIGGGIYSAGAPLLVTDSTVSGNSAGSNGGGIFNQSSMLSVGDSTLSGNSAQSGGGIFNSHGTLITADATVSGNSAAVTGGGIFSTAGANSTLNGTIIASSTPGDLYGTFKGSYNLISDGSGRLSSLHHNILGTTSSPIDAMLAPLGDFGGPTETMPPLPGSPVLSAGASFSIGASVITSDQRGLARPTNTSSNIGAFQSHPGDTSLSSSTSFVTYGVPVTFTATVVPSATGTPTGTITFMNGSTVLGAANLDASAQATFTSSSLSIGSDSITAVYSGDASFLTSTSSALSEVISPLPAAPSGLTVSGVSFSEIDLSWTNNATDQTGFDIERSSDGTNFSIIDQTLATTTIYEDTAANLQPGATYYYEIAAFNASGASPSTSVMPGTLILPDLPYSEPSSGPALPAGADVFSPPIGSQSIVKGAPAIAVTNLSAGANDTLSLTGSGFTDDTSRDFADTRFMVYGQTSSANGVVSDAQIQSSSAVGVLATIPSTEPGNSMYFVWPQNSSGVGLPVAVNQTDVEWIDPSTAVPGGTVSVYGRNLSNGAATPQSWVYLQTDSGVGQWATVTSANPYQVQFTLPANLTPGLNYQVWVYNGHGGKYGWSENPTELTVNAAKSWSGTVNVQQSTTINGVVYPGAKGDGVTDDGLAIQRAISTLKPYETLYFPADTYVVDGERLILPSNVRVMGASMNTSIIRFDGAIATGAGYNPWDIGTESSADTNIDFESIGLKYDGPTTENSNAMVWEEDCSEMTFNNVSLVSSNVNPLRWYNSSDLTMTNSTITGLNVYIANTQDAALTNDLFLQSNLSPDAVDFENSSGLNISDCTTENYNEYEHANNPSYVYNSSDTGLGRFLHFGYLNFDIYGASNTSINLGQTETPTLNNTGEQISFESGADNVTVSVNSATSNSITVSGNEAAGYVGLDAIVTSGVGAGQMQTVASATYNSGSNTTTFKLTGSFAVTPPVGSHINICDDPYNVAFYQNNLNHSTDPSYDSNDTGSAGFQLFEGGYNVVFDDNTVNNARTGISLWSYAYPDPLYFIDVINNTANGVQDGVRTLPSTVLGSDPNGIGIVIRNNIFVGASASYEAADSGVQLYQNSATGSDTLSVVEHNTISGFSDGIIVGMDPDSLIYENSFTLDSGGLGIDFAIGSSKAVVLGNS
jgi:Bacterial Ig-like domain (group 3)/Pectate lyase superfamily protein/Fibronectin type III domain